MTPKGLLPHPKPAEGTPSVHASLVNLSIKVKVLLRLMSPRAFSSRQGVGVFRDFVQFKLTQGSEIVGAGYCVISKRPCEVVRPEGTMAGTIVPKLLRAIPKAPPGRSEEHTSELQSRVDLVCRLLLEKK